jgi:hypothetical protein
VGRNNDLCHGRALLRLEAGKLGVANRLRG